MALITCIDCRAQISDRARACPHCGAPVRAVQDDDPREDVVDYLRRRRRHDRGNTQGCGCLMLIIGVPLCIAFPPLGALLALLGLVILIYGLVR